MAELTEFERKLALGHYGEDIAQQRLKGVDFTNLQSISNITDRKYVLQDWKKTERNPESNRNKDYLVFGNGTTHDEERHEVKLDMICEGGYYTGGQEKIIQKNTNRFCVEIEKSDVMNPKEAKEILESKGGKVTGNPDRYKNKAWFLSTDHAEFYHFVLPFYVLTLDNNDQIIKDVNFDNSITTDKETVQRFLSDDTIEQKAGIVLSYPPIPILTIKGDKLKKILETTAGIQFAGATKRIKGNTDNYNLPVIPIIDETLNSDTGEMSISFFWEIKYKSTENNSNPADGAKIYIPKDMKDRIIKKLTVNTISFSNDISKTLQIPTGGGVYVIDDAEGMREQQRIVARSIGIITDVAYMQEYQNAII